MIEYRKGNILEVATTKDFVIAHGVNCQGVMAAGFAKHLRAKYPWAYESYKEACEQRDPEYNLGRVRYCQDGESPLIAHCFTQLSFGHENYRYVSYDAIDDSMRSIANRIRATTLQLVMPKIGAGLGQGRWPIIEAIINDVFKDRPVIVYTLE